MLSGLWLRINAAPAGIHPAHNLQKITSVSYCRRWTKYSNPGQLYPPRPKNFKVVFFFQGLWDGWTTRNQSPQHDMSRTRCLTLTFGDGGVMPISCPGFEYFVHLRCRTIVYPVHILIVWIRWPNVKIHVMKCSITFKPCIVLQLCSLRVRKICLWHLANSTTKDCFSGTHGK